ncbi:MAG: DUF2059 domain-containing protein [Acidobacteria bacterium]|nr:DUF2059 domain-containing protein [Acidobacteriota bacterium]
MTVENKKSLISQFRKLTGADTVNLSVNVSTDIREDFNLLVAQEKDLTYAQKQELTKSINEANERIDKAAKSFLSDQKTMTKLAEEVIFQIYDKTFTENELRELIAFYQTPTGQKAAAFLPTLSKQVEKAFGDAAIAQLRAIVSPKIEAEQVQFQQKLKDLKNKKQPSGQINV